MNFKVGDFVTCLNPVRAESGWSQHFFTDQHVGTVGSVTKGLVAPIRVDFYQRNVPLEACQTVREGGLWSVHLRWENVKEVPQTLAIAYLKREAPTWEEHLQDLLHLYGGPLYHAVQNGRCQPYPAYPAHAVLVPFVEARPSQQDLLRFLQTFQETSEWEKKTRDQMFLRASTLVLANKSLDEVRIPWTYL